MAANPQGGGAQLVAQDGIKLPMQPAIRPAGNIGLSDRGFFVALDATTAAFNAKLPDPTIAVGQPFVYKKIDSGSNAVTLVPFSAETMDGAASIVLTKQYESVMLISDGTNWQVIMPLAETFNSLNLNQSTTTSGVPTSILTATGAANTGITLSTEAIDINLALARTVQWATGALTTQRQVVVTAPTLAFVGGSTVTNAVLMEVNGIPIAGTNATITTSTALRVVATSADLANTRVGIGITGTFSDGGTTSTTIALGLSVAPTFNYTAASKTGQAYAAYINPTVTSAPSGQNAALALSLTASTLGGIVLNNQTDEQTNYEALQVKWSSNIATIGVVKGGTGTVRSLALATGGTTALTINSSQLVTAAAGVTLTTGALTVSSGNIVATLGNLTVTAGLTSLTGVAASSTLAVVGGVQASGTAATMSVTGAINTAGACPLFVVTGAASTNQTLSTEINFVNFNLGQTVQWATGALTTQRCVLFQAPTFTAVGASTFTRAATVAISGPPVASTNVVITKNPYALFVQAGDVCLAGSGAALATSAITGHTWIPSCAGTPTGAVVGETGAAAIIVDTTGNKIWANVLGTWKGVAIA